MLTKEEKEIIIAVLTKFLMDQEATYKEFETIKRAIEKLTSEE